MICVLTFTDDLASMNIRKALLPSFKKINIQFHNHPVYQKDNIYLLLTDVHCVHAEHIDEEIRKELKMPLELLLFATKHQSKSGIHSLSVHTNGNWGNADFGGTNGFLATCPVRFIHDTYLLLKEKNVIGYEVIIEATHHGPDVSVPSAWIEIGSDESSWIREDAGKIIADVLITILPNFSFELDQKIPVAVGIGGLHHCPEFVKRIERNEAYISHICPKYAGGSLTEDILIQAIEKSVPKANMILLDWKGLPDKKRIFPIIEKVVRDTGIEVKRTKDF
jgi:D-aminoacyl-tRNA deacylase